jgi:hypothetical protein
MEFTSFEANAAQSTEKRRIVILRCENAPLLGLFAPHVYQDLVGIGDAEERRSRILAAVEGRSQALESPHEPKLEGPLLVGLASDEGLGRGAHGRSGPTGLGRHRLVDVWQAVDPRNCARRKGVTSGIPSGRRSLVTPD